MDFEQGKYSAQQVASYYMDVRVAVYQSGGDRKATISAISFVSAVNGTLSARAKTSLIVDGRTIATRTLSPSDEMLLVPGGNQYSYVGETTFTLPHTGKVSLGFIGSWVIQYEAGRFVPIFPSFAGSPISATKIFKLK